MIPGWRDEFMTVAMTDFELEGGWWRGGFVVVVDGSLEVLLEVATLLGASHFDEGGGGGVTLVIVL